MPTQCVLLARTARIYYVEQGLCICPATVRLSVRKVCCCGQEISVDCCTAHSSAAGECGQCHVVSVRVVAEHRPVCKVCVEIFSLHFRTVNV